MFPRQALLWLFLLMPLASFCQVPSAHTEVDETGSGAVLRRLFVVRFGYSDASLTFDVLLGGERLVGRVLRSVRACQEPHSQ